MIDDAVDALLSTLEKRPDKNRLLMWEELEQGQRPTYSGLYLGRQGHRDDAKRSVRPVDDSDEARVAAQILNMLRPLDLENPVTAAFGVGFGTGFMATAFGVELATEIAGAPVRNPRPLSDFDSFEVPDPETAGLLPKVRETIELYKALTPPEIKIMMPDMQGPFNIAHAVLGNDVFTAFTDDTERYHRFMQMVTDFFIRAQEVFEGWIGPERMVNTVLNRHRIAECSCNLISAAAYHEFVEPYDRQLAEHWGEVAIHTCSGPHVFEATLCLPNVRSTECGIIPCASAGSLSLEEALEKVDVPPVILVVGQELERGREEDLIRSHLLKRREFPLLTFSYTGMYWTPDDDRHIVEMHKRLDEFYMEQVASTPQLVR